VIQAYCRHTAGILQAYCRQPAMWQLAVTLCVVQQVGSGESQIRNKHGWVDCLWLWQLWALSDRSALGSGSHQLLTVQCGTACCFSER
jgi:hypothetical protein